MSGEFEYGVVRHRSVARAISKTALKMRFRTADLEPVTNLIIGEHGHDDTPGNDVDLEGLQHCRLLENLEIWREVRNLEPLADLPSLRRLNIWNGRGLTDLGALTGLAELEDLRLNLAPVRDLRPLASLKGLTTLYLNGCWEVTDISPLAELPRLTAIHLRHMSITDLSPLADASSLKTLRIEGLPNLDDLAQLERLPHLVNLTLHDLEGIQSLDGLAALVNLRSLALYDLERLEGGLDELGTREEVTEMTLAPLMSLANLESITLEDLNCIIDFRPLNELPQLTKVSVRGVGARSLMDVRDVQREGGWQWTSTGGDNGWATEVWSRGRP